VFQSRLTQRLEHKGIAVNRDELATLESYFGLLSKWNRTINLTALQLEPLSDEAIDRLFVEPIVAAQDIENKETIWFDLGSGGGSPAVPIKILRPDLQLTMVESRSRKAAFLREVARLLPLRNTRVENVRFENLVDRAQLRESAGLVTVRAVRVDQTLRSVVAFLLRPDGRFVQFGES
jgi:16S rRNA (guanine527-N7)-methyltransferase